MQNPPVAIITAASQGIGKTIAIGLAKKGYRIAAVSRSKEKLEELSRNPCFNADNIKVYPLDVSDERLVQECCKDVISRWGSIDILVNNAGIYKTGTLQTSVEEFDELYRVNLRGCFIFLQNVVPTMKQQKKGYIFNISSICGKHGYEGSGSYCSSKFGIVGLSQSMFKELVPQGIKVTAICPNWVATDMALQSLSRFSDFKLSADEMIQTDDILKTIEWLLALSPSACVEEVIVNCSNAL